MNSNELKEIVKKAVEKDNAAMEQSFSTAVAEEQI